MLLPFAYLQMRTSSFFLYTFSSHYLEFHISIFRRNIFTMHRAYNVDSTTYAYVRVATWAGCCGRTGERTGNIRLRASCDALRAIAVRQARSGNIRLRASCDYSAGLCPSRMTTGNIRLRASCDQVDGPAVRIFSLATYAYVRVATFHARAAFSRESWQHTLTCELRPLSDRFRYQVTLRFICVWTSVQNGFSNSVSVSRRRTRTGHCSLRHFLPPCFAFEVRGFGRLGHALPL